MSGSKSYPSRIDTKLNAINSLKNETFEFYSKLELSKSVFCFYIRRFFLHIFLIKYNFAIIWDEFAMGK